MQLTGPEIKKVMSIPNAKNPRNEPDIIIYPFLDECLGSNSYDLHLAPKLKIYKNTLPTGMLPVIEFRNTKQQTVKEWKNSLTMKDWFESNDAYEYYKNNPMEFDISNPKYALDPLERNKETIDIELPESGALTSPRIGYLGSTIEWTETYNYFPYIDGKSSTGRNFIVNHQTAGRGDDGFCGTWTLEITLKYPTMLYPYMRIGQIYYEKFKGKRKPYNLNPSSHYNKQSTATIAAAVPIEAKQIKKIISAKKYIKLIKTGVYTH